MHAKQGSDGNDDNEQSKNHKRGFVCLLVVGLCGFVVVALKGQGRRWERY